ncbi:hypothetical protein [Massilia sp. CT11-137]|uniref:hypothetical protein n=1 Tax=Massilia sp. CT11-137 TaxID=3393901 RepID=UPI0039A40F3D
MQQTASRNTQFSASHLAAAVLMAFAGVTTASAATLSVGPGKTYAKPCAAIAAAKDGDVIEITGNTTYSGDVCYILRHNLTIRGVNGRPKIDAAGKNAGGKAIWVVDGNNLTVDNVEMYGAKVPDANGAAFRLEAAGFTLRNSFLHDNQNGILANANANSDVVIENTEFGHNGAGDGQSHNLYIGHVKSLTFRYNFSHDANVGHNLKSRADTNLIAYNRFSSLNPGETGSTAAGKPSYEIDLPNAGTSYIIGNIIQQPASNSNPAMLAYGEEGAVNAGSDLYVINNTFINDMGSGGTFMFVSGKVPTPAVAQNNIYAGVGTFSTQGSTIDKTNYRSASPSFANRAAYDLHPVGSALVIDAGSDPGVSAKGVSLKAVAQYKAVAAGEARPVVGQIDIGAYESLTAPTTTTTSWTACGNEGSTCSFSGTREVRFGANGVYTSKMIAASTPCTTAVFGDPIRGVVKSCSYAGTTTAAAPVTGTPTFTACATENGTCSFTGKREVRYGTSTIYTSKIVTGPVKCTNAVFGDPARGQVKSCSYSSVTQ